MNYFIEDRVIPSRFLSIENNKKYNKAENGSVFLIKLTMDPIKTVTNGLILLRRPALKNILLDFYFNSVIKFLSAIKVKKVRFLLVRFLFRFLLVYPSPIGVSFPSCVLLNSLVPIRSL